MIYIYIYMIVFVYEIIYYLKKIWFTITIMCQFVMFSKANVYIVSYTTTILKKYILTTTVIIKLYIYIYIYI